MGRFYISAWSAEESGGIYTFELSPGGIPEKRFFVPFFQSGYLAWNSSRSFLYATGGMDESTDCVGAFAINADGSLAPLNRRASGGLSCCHLCVSPDDAFVYAANYMTGNFSEFAILADGSLSEKTQTVFHSGEGPHPVRQTSAHTHFCGFTPDGKYLLVIDLGIDAVMAYPYIPGRGISAAGAIRNSIKPGAGPRHLVFDRSGKIAYLINELGNTVQSFDYQDGRLTLICEVSTLPDCVKYATKASAIRFSKDEKFLIATNRGFDSIAVFALDGRGNMELCDLVLSGGNSPRDVNFLPGGKVFAAGNEFSNNVYFYDFDAVSGKLIPNGNKLELPRPLCFLPVPEAD